MNPFSDHENKVLTKFEDAVENIKHNEKRYRLTPVIVTFGEGELTGIDLRNFIESGLKIIRFRMTHKLTKGDKLRLIQMLNDAVKWYCAKLQISAWPISVSVDIPNACIRTGFLRDELRLSEISLKENYDIEITSDPKYWNQCDTKRLFIDDPYTIKGVKKGTEISIRFGQLVMVCTKVVDQKTLKCSVVRGSKLGNMEFVCIRGVRHTKPSLTKTDLDYIDFAKELKVDIITVNSLRKPETLQQIRKMFEGSKVPLLMSTICEQEGLNNIDEIIEASDGIILAREFMANEIDNKYKMVAIQMQLGAKCRQHGKPFYISGNILEKTLHTGTVASCDIADVTNAVLQGAGFVLRAFKEPSQVINALKYIDEICKTVEPLTSQTMVDFWRICDEIRVPAITSDACFLACALFARQVAAMAIIALTNSGATAMWLSQILPEAIILAVTTNEVVARRLQIQRGIIPIVYDRQYQENWHKEMDDRVKFAVTFGVKSGILKYGDNYVAMRRSCPTSAYADFFYVLKITVEDQAPNKLVCVL